MFAVRAVVSAFPMSRILLLNKPYGYLSQFSDEGRWQGLKSLIPVPGV